MTEYPRVLIVYMSCLTQTDQHGVSIRSWFDDWPIGRLAQIYSGADPEAPKFCAHTFQLGPDERRWGRLFFKLKNSFLGESSRPISLYAKEKWDMLRQSKMNSMRYQVSSMLIKSGLWEIVFRPCLSDRLLMWVESFQPHIIYCQGYSLTFSWLPVLLSNRFNIPVCFQAGDDWPTYIYRYSIIAWAIRPVVRRAVNELIKKSSVRLANGVAMAEEYAARYGRGFMPMMIGDRFERFRLAKSIRLSGPDTVSLVYSGNLGQGRWRSLAEVCEAAGTMQSEGYRIMITAFVSTVPPEGVNVLKKLANLQILPPPTHDMLPAYLKGADILLLPETFNAVMATEIRLSISTKAHLYMMSEKPILVYGSPLAGIVEYARRDAWASVVDRRDPQYLMAVLRQLIDNDMLRQSLVKQGTQVALENHDKGVIHQRFKEALLAMLGPSPHADDSTLRSTSG